MDQGPKPMDLDARLAAIERILANIDARITVNEELARRNVALTGLSVRRYPLDKSRYEVLVEVTNTMDEEAEASHALAAQRRG